MTDLVADGDWELLALDATLRKTEWKEADCELSNTNLVSFAIVYCYMSDYNCQIESRAQCNRINSSDTNLNTYTHTHARTRATQSRPELFLSQLLRQRRFERFDLGHESFLLIVYPA